MAILSFADDALADFFYDEVIPIRAGWAPVSMQVMFRLEKLDNAKRVQDMALPPGNQLHRLHGNLADFYSVRINRLSLRST